MYDREPAPRCDNSSGRLGGAIVAPGCPGNPPTRTVTINYDAHRSDVLSLCDGCSKTVARDARRHGYKITGAAR